MGEGRVRVDNTKSLTLKDTKTKDHIPTKATHDSLDLSGTFSVRVRHVLDHESSLKM